MGTDPKMRSGATPAPPGQRRFTVSSLPTATSSTLPSVRGGWLGAALQHPRTAWVVPTVALLLTVLAVRASHLGVRARVLEQFERRVGETQVAIQERMLHYEQVLRGAIGLFAASDRVTRDEWRSYVRALEMDRRLPGIQGLGFVARIPQQMRPFHVASVQDEGIASYEIRPPGNRPESFPSVYLEPYYGRNVRELGFDMSSEPVRWHAMIRARDSGEPVLSGRVRLEQEAHDLQREFMLFAPVYRRGHPANALAERQRALIGFVYSTFRGQDLMKGIFANQAGDVAFEIYDGRAAAPDAFLYGTHGSTEPMRVGPGELYPYLATERTLLVGGRFWLMRFRPGPEFEPGASLGQPHLVAAGGLFISVLLFLIITSVSRTQKRAVALAERMTVGMREAAGMMREQQGELLRAKNAAEEATRAKSQFLARMSHEMRTPLGGVVGMLDLALLTPLSAVQTEYLKTASSSANALLEIINEVLDFSKIEARKLALDTTGFSLRDLLAQLVRGLAGKAQEKGLELLVDNTCPGSGMPDRWRGDPMRLRQVLTNLVGNAIKFTEQGEIIITVSARTAPDGTHLVGFRISDTGIGIPRAQQRAIFEAFQQADETVARRFGGTGLGLSISSQLVMLMGGTLGVESEEGRGSVFYFDLPLEPDPLPAPAEPPAPARRLPAERALVLAQHPLLAAQLIERLTSFGLQPEAAPTTVEAVVAVERAAAELRPFRWLVLDRDLEEVEATTLLSALARPSPDAPGIVVVAPLAGPARDRAERFNAFPGITPATLGVVRKPILDAELRAVLGRIADRATRGTPPAGVPVLPRLERTLRVLVAEDNRTNQLITRRLLELAGQQVTIVADGRAAVAAVEGGRFDVVLMDVRMPEMDGLEATRAIRAREQASGGSRLPIVALTAQALVGDREECLAAGMDGYVTKPLRPDLLFEAIRRVTA